MALGNFTEEMVDLAKVYHEALRVYCSTIGQTLEPWDEAPEWKRQSSIKNVTEHFFKIRRGDYIHPNETHDKWMKERIEQGWIYGPVKDENKKTNPCLVAYGQLPITERLKDYLLIGIVHAFVRTGLYGNSI